MTCYSEESNGMKQRSIERRILFPDLLFMMMRRTFRAIANDSNSSPVNSLTYSPALNIMAINDSDMKYKANIKMI